MHAILKFFASLRTAIILIALIAVLSMIGTLVPQMREADDYLRQFPQLGHWILALGFDDMYHGLVFQISIWLLAISTFVCTLLRIRLTKRRLFHRLDNVSVGEIKAFHAHCSVTLPKDKTYDSETFKSKTTSDGNKIFFKAHGRASLIGGLFIHIGFLILLAGGLTGLLFSSEMTLSGRQGDILPVPPISAISAAMLSDHLAREGRNIREFSPKNPKLDKLRTKINALREKYIQGQAHPAFKLKFEKLWVDYYKDKTTHINTGVKGWHTNLDVIKNGLVVATASLSVNSPFTYGGITLYQANWNQIYRKINLRVNCVDDGKNTKGWVKIDNSIKFPRNIELTVGKPFKPDWSSATFLLKEFMPDFRIMGNRFVSVSNNLNNPAGQIIALDDSGNEIGRAWAFSQAMPMASGHVTNMPFNFTFVSAKPEFETGLQLSYDPGKSFVWFGCLLFTLGTFLTFYIIYREEWIVIMPSGEVIVAVHSNESKETLEERLNQFKDNVLNIK